MTLTSLIWKVERFIIGARCFRCWNFNNELEMCSSLPNCNFCKSNVRVLRNSNCMYYKRNRNLKRW